MDAIKAILRASISNAVKCSSLVNIVREHEEIYITTVELLTAQSQDALLASFLTEYEYPSTKRRKTIIANSGSEWTTDELRYFMITFRDTDTFDRVCKHFKLTIKAQKFIDMNEDLTRKNAASLTRESALFANTEFKKDMLFAVNVPSNESSIDDMIMTLLSDVMSDRFLIKTRYDMKLHIANQYKKAIADVIAVLFPQLYVGLVVVEDKPHDTSRTEHQWDNAEAQTIAEAIAVMQQKQWPMNLPVYALRVLETFVTIYKLEYDKQLIADIRTGARRDTLYVVHRFLPETLISGQKPGWDLLDPTSRHTIVNAINDICISIESAN